jgi:hypothetical protein
VITPSGQWAIMIDITTRCPRQCSNCTRMVGHHEPWDMDLDTFRLACDIGWDFAQNSMTDNVHLRKRTKVVGLIGGEPLLHPEFLKIIEIMKEKLPGKSHRGLSTAMPPGPLEPMIQETFGYFNRNPHSHDNPSHHQPGLVAIKDVIKNKDKMWQYIDRCPLQYQWCSSMNPRGFYACEIMAAREMLEPPEESTATPLETGCWNHPLEFYWKQFEKHCPMCGWALPLTPRLDREERDDVSPSSLEWLRKCGSKRVAEGRYVEFDCDHYTTPRGRWQPLVYMEHMRK